MDLYSDMSSSKLRNYCGQTAFKIRRRPECVWRWRVGSLTLLATRWPELGKGANLGVVAAIRGKSSRNNVWVAGMGTFSTLGLPLDHRTWNWLLSHEWAHDHFPQCAFFFAHWLTEALPRAQTQRYCPKVSSAWRPGWKESRPGGVWSLVFDLPSSRDR